jgi:hypothetical protein
VSRSVATVLAASALMDSPLPTSQLALLIGRLYIREEESHH